MGQQSVPPTHAERNVPVMLRDPASGGGVIGQTTSTVLFHYVRSNSPIMFGFTPVSWTEVDAANCPGLYLLVLPGEVRAPGADWVVIYLRGAAFAPEVLLLQLDLDAAIRRPGNHRNEV